MTRVRIEDSESHVKIGSLFCMDALLENSLRVHLSRKTSRLLKSYEIVNVALAWKHLQTFFRLLNASTTVDVPLGQEYIVFERERT